MWMQNGTATLENSLAVSHKVKHTFTIWISNSTASLPPQRNENVCQQKDLFYMNVPSTLFMIVK